MSAEELTATEYRVPLTIAEVDMRTVTFVAPAEWAPHMANATAMKNAYAMDLAVNFVGGVKIDRDAEVPTITSFLTRPVGDWDNVAEQWVAVLHRDHRPRAKRKYQLTGIEPADLDKRWLPKRKKPVKGYGGSKSMVLDQRI